MQSHLSVVKEVITFPEKYLGTYSLQCLNAYFHGYLQAHSPYAIDCLEGFSDYVAKKYQVPSNHGWPSIIDFFSNGEMDAFNRFVRLFEDFIAEKAIMEEDHPLGTSPVQQLDVIVEVSRFPEIYLGSPSLIRLEAFLRGCGHGESAYDIVDLDRFSEYVRQRERLQTNRRWSEIIRFCSYDDNNAYDWFVKLFNAYLIEEGYSSKPLLERGKHLRGRKKQASSGCVDNSKVNDLYKMLQWNGNYGRQLQGIKLAQELDDLSLLILPDANGKSKGVWENCARALYEISDDRLERYLPSLLEWLQDLNWPGALIILDRLKAFSGEKLKKPFMDRFTFANSLNNEEGLMWLDYLSELLDNEELKAVLPKPIIEKLKKHYKNWGFWYNDD